MSADTPGKMAASNVSSNENLTECFNMPEKSGGFESNPQNFGEIVDCEKLEIDLAVKCRGCFVEDPEMHYLFTVFDQKLSLADILMQTTPFVCKEDDGFPPYLCTKCTTCLIDFFNFKIQFQKTDIYVRTLLGKSNPQTIDAVTIKAEVDWDQGSQYEDTNFEEEPQEERVEEEKYIPYLQSFEEQTYCEVCNIHFEDNAKQVTHMAQEHGQNPFMKYKLFKSMVLDNEKATIEAKKRMKQEEEDLKEKILQETPGKLCRFCRKKFPEEQFAAHWELHKTNVCELCGYKCVKKADLELHCQGVHNTERNYTCHLCDRSFKTKPLLKRHQVVHTQPRRYCCDLCGQRFNDGSTLKTHIHLKHEGSRDYICPICGLAFPMKATLDKHIIRHNKNRPATFYCSLCPATFRDKSSMTRHHLVKHTNDFQRPVCEFCGKSYCSKTKLRMHVERHHSGRHYERKRRTANRVSDRNDDGDTSASESDDSEAESSEETYEEETSRSGPRVMNVSEEFYKEEVVESYVDATVEEEHGQYFMYKDEDTRERGSESTEAESDYE